MCDETRPAGLMAGAESGPRLAMKVLVEQQSVPVIGNGDRLFGVTLVGTLLLLVGQEQPHQSCTSRNRPPMFGRRDSWGKLPKFGAALCSWRCPQRAELAAAAMTLTGD